MADDDTDSNEVLQELDDNKARALIPAMTYCGILMITGTLGNLMVVYFYGFKSKTTSATCFIIALAVFDMITCVFGIPIEITDMRFFYLFKSKVACHLLVFVNHFSVIASALTLCFIAFDRFKRICKPFNQQLSVKRAKIMIAVSTILGVAFGWPSVVLYTVENVAINTTYNGNYTQIIGYDCTSIKDDSFDRYVWAYNILQFFGFFVILTALVVFYVCVGRQLYKHKKFRFYINQNCLRRTASGNSTCTTTTLNTDIASEPVGTNTIPVASSPEEDKYALEVVEYEGPDVDYPITKESIPDLRAILELDVGGLPTIDCDRPPSSHTNFLNLGKLGVSNSEVIDRTINGHTRSSIIKVRSIVVCHASANQVLDLESSDLESAHVASSSMDENDSTLPSSIREKGNADKTLTRPSHKVNACTPSDIRDIDSACNEYFYKNNKEIQGTDNTRKLHELFGGIRNVSGIELTKGNTCVNSKTVISRTKNMFDADGLRRTSSENSCLGRNSFEGNGSEKVLHGNKSKKNTNTDLDSLKDLRFKMLDLNTVKLTVIMITITGLFLGSCLPYLGLAVWRVYSNDNLVYSFSDVQLVWFSIGLRSYFLNCAINPFIYGFCNSQFRKYFYKAWCLLCKHIEKSDAG